MSPPAATKADKPQRRSAVRWFAGFCVILLAVLVWEHAGRMGRVGFTTHDDLVSDLFAADARKNGFGAAWHQAGVIARGQGRVSYYVSYFLNIAPYLVDDGPVRTLLITGVHFLSLAAVCAFVGLYLGPEVALLSLTAMYALLPHWWRYFPIGAYPIQFHAAVLFFFVAAIIQVLTIRLELSRRAAWAMRIPSLALLYCSLSVYEASTALFAAVSAVALVCEWRRAGPERRAKVRTAAACMGTVFLFYAALFVGFRIVHPSTYEGNQLAAFHPGAAVAATLIYAAGGLPLAHLYFQAGTIGAFSAHSLPQLGAVRFLLRELTAAGLVEGALFAAAALVFVRRVGLGREWRRPMLAAAGTACLFALVATAPIAVAARYQQNPLSKTPHVPGYFSYLCFMVAGACGLGAAATVVPRLNRRTAAVISLPAAAALLATVALTQEANEAVVRSQEAHSATWRAADRFLRSEAYERLPENATVVAPALWNEIDPAWPYAESYWSNYFRAHSGKNVRVLRQPGAGGGYYLEIQAGATPK